jgi:hypothetical protein
MPGADPYADLVELRAEGELALWKPVGRPVRTGTWVEQSEPTPDRIVRALAEGRHDDAAALVRHLLVEAQEIHELYTDWVAALPRLLQREGAAAQVEGIDAEAEWDEFRVAVETLAARCAGGEATAGEVDELADRWREAHDRHLELVASWLDAAVSCLGEERLGAIWAELQAPGIAAYRRYDTGRTAWETSHALLVQIAIEGMHGHLGGPDRRGAVEVHEHDDRVELRFSPCGSGGVLRAREAFGVTEARHDFAWNELGVCHYCIHCCVLQQLTPIDRLGYPARVVDPPLRAGDPCSWSVYRDPSLVPEEAYRRVGREKPDNAGGSHG